MSRFERLGLWTAEDIRFVAGAWMMVLVGPGALAPFAEGALSGVGWQPSGSSSLAARRVLDHVVSLSEPVHAHTVSDRIRPTVAARQRRSR